MTVKTEAVPLNYAAIDLGPPLCTYGSGFSSTYLLVGFGVFMILIPVVLAIAAASDGDSNWFAYLFIEVLFLPLGLFTMWRGLRQRRCRLTIRERGFEYLDGKGRLRAARYTDVEKLVLRTLNESPTAIAVHLHNGDSIVMDCLALKGLREGYDDLERRL